MSIRDTATQLHDEILSRGMEFCSGGLEGSCKIAGRRPDPTRVSSSSTVMSTALYGQAAPTSQFAAPSSGLAAGSSWPLCDDCDTVSYDRQRLCLFQPLTASMFGRFGCGSQATCTLRNVHIVLRAGRNEYKTRSRASADVDDIQIRGGRRLRRCRLCRCGTEIRLQGKVLCACSRPFTLALDYATVAFATLVTLRLCCALLVSTRHFAFRVR